MGKIIKRNNSTPKGEKIRELCKSWNKISWKRRTFGQEILKLLNSQVPLDHISFYTEQRGRKALGIPEGRLYLRSSMKTSQIELAHHSKLFCIG